ncbi:MAG TPA: cytochrome c [Saprospiraceae bacterium]|nr:cytochrome c [Saprospiraceae bacterium]
MKKIVIIIVSIATIVACGGNKSNSSSSSVDGAKIYKLNCVLCHGDDGKLGLNDSKDLTLTNMTLDERIAIIRNGKNAMTGFGNLLKEEEIRAVAEYTLMMRQ